MKKWFPLQYINTRITKDIMDSMQTESKPKWATPARIAYWDSLKGIKGKNAPHWKGDKIGKSAVHCWLNTVYGKPKLCERCGTTNDNKIYEWANKDHKYRRLREDFKRLCRSCHRKYDGIIPPSRKNQQVSEEFKEKLRQFSHIRPRFKGQFV